MLSSTISFAVHLYSSLQGVQTIGRALGRLLPYSTMVGTNKRNFNTPHLKTGKVPALEIAENVSIYESLVTVEYLDDVYPQRPLLPKDPVKKAKDKILVEALSPIHTVYFKLVRGPDTITEDNIAAYHKNLTFIQQELQNRGTKFLDGDQPGYADYMIWPWFERLHVIKHDLARLDKQKYKLLLEYIDNMFQDPVVAEYKLPREALEHFQNQYKLGLKPVYDLLIQK
ncbi:hypothetical protein HF086_017004 [Spodoptera exigua]|uniref:Uncharacterized protein n=1 Tax=Spodoptera exigua TaxID=7107 RepID=A0A922S9V2_SPOEX|nr:hypothetical protein HF086_017004 [Spodoptera exigua]